MAVTSGWDLGSEADRQAGWGRTVPLGVAGVTRRGPVDERAACCLWVVRFQGVGDGHPRRSGLGVNRPEASCGSKGSNRVAWFQAERSCRSKAMALCGSGSRDIRHARNWKSRCVASMTPRFRLSSWSVCMWCVVRLGSRRREREVIDRSAEKLRFMNWGGNQPMSKNIYKGK
jgi:hypothetical protein